MTKIFNKTSKNKPGRTHRIKILPQPKLGVNKTSPSSAVFAEEFFRDRRELFPDTPRNPIRFLPETNLSSEEPTLIISGLQ